MAVALARTSVALWLVATVAAAVHERYAAVETGAVLLPRFYPAEPALPLRKRQEGCDAGTHTCIELGAIGEGACCLNDQYCIVNTTNPSLAACCRIGSTCGSPCAASQIQCFSTITSTLSGGAQTTSLSPACCARRCPATSSFGCPSSLGNGCCAHGSSCIQDGCVSTLAPSTTPRNTPVVPGCSTSQITCPASLGGGCCPEQQSCTLVSGSGHCAPVPITPTPSGLTQEHQPDADLSTGAKAGIAVGVVVAAAIVIGVATWFCLRRRRNKREAGTAGTTPRRPRDGVIGMELGGHGGRAFSDADTSEMLSLSARPPNFLGGNVRAYTGPVAAIGPYSDTPLASPTGSPPPHVQDLWGFPNGGGINGNNNIGGVGSGGGGGGMGGAGGEGGGGEVIGGVPLQPDTPGDIPVPVEIDSRQRQVGGGGGVGQAADANEYRGAGGSGGFVSPIPEGGDGEYAAGGNRTLYERATSPEGTEGAHFELYGSDMVGRR